MGVLGTLGFQPTLITDAFESMTASKTQYDKNKPCLSGVPVFPSASRTKASNGIDSFYPRQDKVPEAGNAVTIGLDTQTAGYQPVPFYTSQNTQVLHHERLNESDALVLSSLIRGQVRKFSWGGNGATLGRLKRTRIMVPALTTAGGTIEVDQDSMDRLDVELLDQVITYAHSAYGARLAGDDTLPELRFGPMRIGELFTLHREKQGIPVGVSYGGKTPYVAAASHNNSQVGWVKGEALFPGRWLIIVNTGAGDVGYCTYQPVPFWASNNVTALGSRQNDLTTDALIVITGTIQFQCFGVYRYKSITNNRRVTNQRIIIPVVTDASGEDVVGWEGMSAYGRALRVRIEWSLTPILEEAP